MNTVEGAVVFASLAVTTGVLLAGFGTVSAHSAAQSIARDAARSQALGADGRALALARFPEATVSVNPVVVAGQQAVTVSVELPAPLFDVTATATVLAEPEGD